MRVPRARVPSLVGFGQDSERDQRLRQGGTVRLHNPALAVARIGWVAMAALSTALFVASLPAHYTQLASVSVDPEAGAVRAGLWQLGLAPEIYAGYTLALKIAFAAAFLAIGLFIFWRKSAERLPLLLSLTLVLFGATFPNTLGALVANHPNWGAVVSALEYYAIFSFFLLFCLFPDGAFVPPWTRAAAVAWVALGGGLMFFPGSVVDPSTWPLLLSGPVFFGFLGAFLFAQVHRYRRVSGPIQRQQTKWVVFGFSVAIAGFLAVGIPGDLIPALHQPGIPAALYDLTSTTVFVCALLPVPLSIGASILRYRLWDIDVVIHHSLVYGALTAGVVGLYVLVVGYLGALFNTGGNLVISLIATGLVAVLFQPLRDRLQRGVNHLMYGERDDPYAVLARLGRRLEATLAPDAVLPTIVSTVQEALKLPYVAIALPRDEEEEFAITAAAGQPPADLLQVPLIYQGDVVGQLLLGPRAPGEAFTSADRRLLDDLAHHAGVAVHGVRVMTDLQRSRERLVLAREEERRRLRRDLHDELAPTLAALGLTAATVGELIQTDPEAAAVVNAKLQTAIRAAVGDIRRLVYDLRPPTLDELGLVDAIRERAMQYTSASHAQGGPNPTAGFQVTVEVPAPLPALAAAVEVAAYRIVQEALMNVSRHAHARTCLVRLTCVADETLQVEIIDDGIGLPDPAERGGRTGVGLRSMRERAIELGGTCLVERAMPTGTRIVARLPLGRPM